MQAVGVRRSSSRRQRKSIPKLRPPPLHGKPRPRKRRAYAHFGWPRKQPTRILQIAPPRQRRPGDLSRADAFEDLRSQPRQNPSNAQRDFCPPSRQVWHHRRSTESCSGPRPIVSRRSVPSTCAPQTEALPRSAPRRSAPRKSAWSSFAPWKLTSPRQAPARSACHREAPPRSARFRVAPLSRAWSRLHRRRSTPLRSARRRSALQNARPERRVPTSSARAPAAPPLSTQVPCSLRMAAKASSPSSISPGCGPPFEVILH
jgi:hypothetical protein